MFSFLKRFREEPPTEQTFNKRVTEFWEWFEKVAPRYTATIDKGECASLTDETSERVDRLSPGLAWVYGPGENGNGHSLTISGEGKIHQQLLTLHCVSMAPTIEGWTFYGSRQSGPIKGHSIEMGGNKFSPEHIWVTPSLDVENRKVNITVWHPLWETLEKHSQNTVTFLFLDEALGEYGTDQWIGSISLEKNELADAFPLSELADYIQSLISERGWKEIPPGECFTLFKVTPSDSPFPRSDVFSQISAVPKLITGYLDSAGELQDPLAGSGADYLYVSISSEIFTPDKIVEQRGRYEGAFDAALNSIRAGKCIGGAVGTDRVYVDLIIFDGSRSLDAVKSVIAKEGLPKGTMIEYFAREKRGSRIAT